MRVKSYIEFKGEFKLTYIGRIGKKGIFNFRNNQLKKACLNKLKVTFHYDCPGGSLTIPDINRYPICEIVKQDKYVVCYESVIPEKKNSKHIVTYLKNN